MSKGLLIVDPQLDFMPGGALAVPNGDKIIGPLNKAISIMGGCDFGQIFMSMDWHPERTSHFDHWPVHCRRGFERTYPPDNLNIWELFTFKFPVFYKGFRQDEDCYSAFDGFNSELYPLEEVLKQQGVYELYVGGLATDYCVKATVLDALKFGFPVSVLTDCIAAVKEDSGERAIAQMCAAGARIITTETMLWEVKAIWA